MNGHVWVRNGAGPLSPWVRDWQTYHPRSETPALWQMRARPRSTPLTTPAVAPSAASGHHRLVQLSIFGLALYVLFCLAPAASFRVSSAGRASGIHVSGITAAGGRGGCGCAGPAGSEGSASCACAAEPTCWWPAAPIAGACSAGCRMPQGGDSRHGGILVGRLSVFALLDVGGQSCDAGALARHVLPRLPVLLSCSVLVAQTCPRAEGASRSDAYSGRVGLRPLGPTSPLLWRAVETVAAGPASSLAVLQRAPKRAAAH